MKAVTFRLNNLLVSTLKKVSKKFDISQKKIVEAGAWKEIMRIQKDCKPVFRKEK